MAPFQYTPLGGAPGDRMIRLLKLYPSSNPSAPLQCDLFHTQLGSCAFEAVSYSWGSSKTPHVIICNGDFLPLGDNILGALIHFQSRNEGDRPRTLWVDAICTNQKDNDEKNQQVQMMRDIYAEAEMTLIWLGPGNMTSLEAFGFARGLLSTLPPETLIALSLANSRDYGSQVSDLIERLVKVSTRSSREYGLSQSDGLYSILQVLERRWFTRVWVIQELAMAKSAQVICGSDQMPWEHFHLAVKATLSIFASRERPELQAYGSPLMMVFHPGGSPLQFYANRGNEGFEGFGKRLIMSLNDTRSGVQAGNLPNLSHALLKHYAADATNPLDHVYAILGFTSTNSLPAEDRLRIDYSLDATTVFKEATLHCIETEVSLDVLMTLGSSKEESMDGLPSWVPDWSSFDPSFTPLGLYSRYSCSKDSTPEVRFIEEDNVLVISGHTIDRIGTPSEPLPEYVIETDYNAVKRAKEKF